MKTKTLMRYLLTFVLAFSSLIFVVKAESLENENVTSYEMSISNGESVNAFEKAQISGRTIKKIVSQSSGNPFDLSGCAVGSSSCVVKLKSDGGLWKTTGFVWVLLDNDEEVAFNFDITDWYPVVVSLGDFQSFNYSTSVWENYNHSNSTAIVSNTRDNINLPTASGEPKAANGLPIKFAGFVDVTYSYPVGAGDTATYTMPVQEAGQCASTGYGTLVSAGTSVKGTGPHVYIACYEYQSVAMLSLSGGTFVNAGAWTYNDSARIYQVTSSTTLPGISDVEYKFGTNVKKVLNHWETADGETKQPGETIEADGKTWYAVFDYDASGNASYNDRAVYYSQTTTVSLSGTTVTSCSSADTSIVTATVENGVCKVTGVKVTDDDEFAVVTVSYSNTRTEKYNFQVWDSMAFSDETTFTPEIQVIGIQDEETSGNAGLSFSTCASYATGDLVSYGTCSQAGCTGGRLSGSNVIISIYYAEGCGSGRMTGLCMDPGIAGPHGATYVRDTSLDGVFTQYASLFNKLKSGPYPISNSANVPAINTAFRIIMGHLGYSRGAGTQYTGIFAPASAALGRGDVNGALNIVFPSSLSGDSGASRNREIVSYYLNEFLSSGSGSTTAADASDFKVEKTATFVKTGDDSYELHYTGTISVPTGVNIQSGTYSNNSNSLHFSTSLTVTGETSEGKYAFTAVVTVPSARDLEVPANDTEKAAVSVQIELADNALVDIFMIHPADGSTRQQLLFFDEGTRKLTLYLPPYWGTDQCNTLISTMLSTCNTIVSGDSNISYDGTTNGVSNATNTSECNYELVKTCCSLIDEGAYPYLADNICANKCSYNTVGEVCDYKEQSSANTEAADLFTVREGYKKSGTDAGKNLGTCVVNTADFSQSRDTALFTKYDGAGNTINVASYDGNKYCKVTCREEWDLTSGTFGSYMGAESVRAGSYFSIDKADIFIRGDRYCYTSYLDTSSSSKYMQEQRTASIELKKGYNVYSKAAHEYNDLTAVNGSGSSSLTLYKPTTSYETGGSVTYCKEWNEVTVYHCDDWDTDEETGEDYCTDWSTYTDTECTSNSTRYDDYHPSEYTDKKQTVSYVNQIHLTMQYNGGDANGGGSAGQYRKYNETTASDYSSSLTSYDNQASGISCVANENKSDGHSDTVTCTIGTGGSFTVKESDTKNKDITDKLKKKIVGTGTADTVKADDEGLLFNNYYTVKKAYLLGLMSSGIATVTAQRNTLYTNASDWYACENFVLYTKNYTGVDVSSADKSNATGSSGLDSSFKILGSTGTPTEIQTIFNPKVSYVYDETVYMNLLTQGSDSAQDNILVRNDAKNSAVKLDKLESEINVGSSSTEKYTYFDPTNVSNNIGTSTSTTLHLTSGDTSNQLNYSYKKASTYTATSPWVVNSNNAKNYGSDTDGSASFSTNYSDSNWVVSVCMIGAAGTNNTQGQTTDYIPTTGNAASQWVQGNCYKINLPYYTGVNYISRSVSNSSYYKNKGNWYTGADATVIHGDNVDDAKANFKKVVSGSKVDTVSKWSLLGLKNTFPVSITTPRNLYKYSYIFTNIGSYAGDKAGRLMGNDDSVFQNNTRTCFYEVVESICKCCGDVSTHEVTASTVGEDVTSNFVASHGLSYTTSNKDKISTTTDGEVGFFNTVSSLSNLSAISDNGTERTLASNWTDQEIFNYNGYNRYVTNKGAVAAKAIESVGEEIYSSSYSAEYAYTLTPDAISEIKQNNMSNQYGVIYDSDHVVTYGTVLLALNTSESGIDNQSTKAANGADLTSNDSYSADTISYGHIGSKFLEDVASKYAKGDSADGTFKNLNLASYTSSNNVCYIEESDTNGSGKNIADKLYEKVEGGCRWVDYIEESGTLANYGTCDPAKDLNCVQKFRLAFK